MNPDDFTIQSFDLTALIKLNDLNLHYVAEENNNLTIGNYYEMLSQFLHLAPDVSGALKIFAEDDTGNKDWKIIKSMITLFGEMNCYKYIPGLDGIRNAHGKGDHKLAATLAGNIRQGFDDLYMYISSAKIPADENCFPGSGKISQIADLPLIKCLKMLSENETESTHLVLAIDDSPAILEAVSAVLSGEYRVFKLPKPTMLEEVLKKVHPDLFLLDYHMPDINGFELIGVIRKIEKYRHTPVIFLTSEGTVDNITAAVGLGACDFIVKPFNPDQLREKVAKHIVRKHN